MDVSVGSNGPHTSILLNCPDVSKCATNTFHNFCSLRTCTLTRPKAMSSRSSQLTTALPSGFAFISDLEMSLAPHHHVNSPACAHLPLMACLPACLLTCIGGRKHSPDPYSNFLASSLSCSATHILHHRLHHLTTTQIPCPSPTRPCPPSLSLISICRAP